jgi:hypothetical protein
VSSGTKTDHGSNVRPCPQLEQITLHFPRKECGAHLLLNLNAFWRIKHFGVQQMLPRDGMHVIDLAAIVRLILAMILLKYFHFVENELDQEGLAAARMDSFEARLRMYLARRNDPDGQMSILSLCKYVQCAEYEAYSYFDVYYIFTIFGIF